MGPSLYVRNFHRPFSQPQPMPRTNRTKSRQQVGASVNGLLAELLSLKRGAPDKVPAGHLTCEQWAKVWKMSKHKAFRLLKLGMEKGKVAVAKHRIDTGTKVHPVAHYYEVKRGR